MRMTRSDMVRVVSVVLGMSFPAIGLAALTELATVNKNSITDRDLKLALSGLNEGQRSSVLKDQTARKQILEEVIDQELLAQEAEKLKLDTESEFKDLLFQHRKQLLTSRLLEKKFGAQLTAAAIKSYYEHHKDLFNTDEVHAQHILLADEHEAKKILEMAKDSSNDFQALAEKYSKDPSAKNNRGDLGFFPRGRFVPEFAEAAFKTGDGKISGPVKTVFGYHIIKVIEKKTGKMLGFDEVELQARDALRRELIQNYVDGLRAQAKIKVNVKALEKL